MKNLNASQRKQKHIIEANMKTAGLDNASTKKFKKAGLKIGKSFNPQKKGVIQQNIKELKSNLGNTQENIIETKKEIKEGQKEIKSFNPFI
jgi:ABC-type Zn2+ transport system substrate-binding protein/surface adhesin